MSGSKSFRGGLLDELRRGQVGFAEIELENVRDAHRDLGQFANAGMGDSSGGSCDAGGQFL
ncbi:MAG: hypothetical protein JO307_24990 [Bryobacterales bacterium]|nr:hypothetical protein [Bryobacterales bacterium]MBV9401471.1 hypothetical protein [Bryobacterales bacterium]